MRRVHLIRHADALTRRSWSDPDAARPLSEKGHRQALWLAELHLGPIGAIHSSPALRCRDTVVPLSVASNVEVVIDDRLAEGADPQRVVDWVTSGVEPVENLVLCSHGDVLPGVLRLLTMLGMTLDGPNVCQKASVWTCAIEGTAPTRAGYTPPS